MTKRPNRAAMLAQARRWLDSGLLASALPARLMAEYGLSPVAARELAAAAIREWRGRGGETREAKEKPGE